MIKNKLELDNNEEMAGTIGAIAGALAGMSFGIGAAACGMVVGRAVGQDIEQYYNIKEIKNIMKDLPENDLPKIAEDNVVAKDEYKILEKRLRKVAIKKGLSTEDSENLVKDNLKFYADQREKANSLFGYCGKKAMNYVARMETVSKANRDCDKEK